MPCHPAPGLVVSHGFLDGGALASIERALDADPGEATEVRSPAAGAWAVQSDVRRAWEVVLPDDLHGEIVRRIEGLRPELEAHFGLALEPCETVAALRYPAGAFYRTHRDASDHPADEVYRRAVSVVVFVNGDAAARAAYGGGRLRLYGPLSAPLEALPVEAPVEPGTLVAFPSDWLHEVTPVAWGERRTIVTWLMRAAEAGPGP
jgi:predicted 2-oxoglutarate/Fe(II)-dependent dioxygenase YbiX